MIRKHIYYLRLVLVLLINNSKSLAQEPLILDKERLVNSFIPFSQDDISELKKNHHFISDWWYKDIYSTSSFNDLVILLEKIELPFSVKLLENILIINCYNSTEAYSNWYVVISNSNQDFYYYFIDRNTREFPVKHLGKTIKINYFDKIANLLYSNRSEKSEDYMSITEIYNSEVAAFKSTQTFHIADDAFFKMIMRLIKESNN